MVSREFKLGMGGKYFKPFTIVDIVTIILFAGLFRDFFMLIRQYTFPFPWRHPLWYLACLFCMGVVLAVTRKPGSIFLYTLAWLAIDLFIVHEIPAWLVFLATSPWIPEYYLFYRARKEERFDAAIQNWRDLMLVGGSYTLLAFTTNMILIVGVIHTPFTSWWYLPIGGLSLLMGLLGTWLGILFGRSIVRWTHYE